MSTDSRRNLLLFAALCAASLVVAVVYVYMARGRVQADAGAGGDPSVRAAHPEVVASVRRGPHLAFRNLIPGDDYGVMSFAPLDAAAGPRELTNLRCLRLYQTLDAGLCLTIVDEPLIAYKAYVLDGSFNVRHSFALPGLPSRARVSRDGTLAAYTVFTTADSYMTVDFSTRTRIVDVASGKTLADLEEFSATRDGVEFKAVDFNYWGVTFARTPTKFYATLGTQRKTYLVEGDLNARKVVTIRENVECPSLSPDETRIAFKKRVDSGRGVVWHPAILTLATGAETVLSTEQSVDDQIEWLDNDRVVYAIRESQYVRPRRATIWTARADGAGEPSILAEDAESPAVVRPTGL